MSGINFSRKWCMPNKNTFLIKPITELLKEEVKSGLWLDLFANNNTIKNIIEDVEFITNDLNKEYKTDYNLDALDFLKLFNNSFADGILYDPPFSPRQVSECYKELGMTVNMQTTQASYWAEQKKEIARVVKIGGKVITFSWNSGGIGKGLGFEIERILLVPHGGWHNDTIIVVERKII